MKSIVNRWAGITTVMLALLFMQPVYAKGGEVLWLGHATTRITSIEGKVIVIDPFLKKNPKTPQKYKDLAALGKVDVILVTHGHMDHVADLSELARLTGATVVANAELVRQMVAMGQLDQDKTIAMNKSGTVTPVGDGIRIHMVRAEHSSSLVFGQAAENEPNMIYAGEPVGYVIEFENGYTIYHSGDTGVFGDMALIGQMYEPDLAMISIGGYYTMDGKDAGFAMAKLMKPTKVLPIHYGTFPVLTGTPQQLKDALGGTDIEVLDLMPGQSVTF